MSGDRPTTAAFDELDRTGVVYRAVPYGEVRSAAEAAAARGVPIDALVKTLVVRISDGDYALVLVPGDLGLDYQKLRAHLGVRRLTMPDAEEARAATGYARGTITPFGAGDHRVIVDRTLLGHDEISLGSGAPGWAIHLDPAVLLASGAEAADVAS